MPVQKCSPEGMAWWISAALSSKGLPVGQPTYQAMIRELVAQTYAAGGWLACEVNSPMQGIMIQHGPKSGPQQPPAQAQVRPQYPPAVQNDQGMPLGPNSVPPPQRYPQPVQAPQAPQTTHARRSPGEPLQVQQNPGMIENTPGRHVSVEAPVFTEFPEGSNGDSPPSMALTPEPTIEY